MHSSARENYLVAEVMTATPQKLHLTLIEAAIRFAERGRLHWRASENEKACEALIRAQQIMGELLAGLNREIDPELVKRLASLYMFVFRCLMEANTRRDENKLNDALRVLQVERETWRMVCQQPIAGRSAAGDVATLSVQTGSPAVPPAPHLPNLRPAANDFDSLPMSGLSLEG